MNNNTRRYTRYALELADNGILSWKQLAESCLYYLSDEAVYRMMQANDMLPEQTEFEDKDVKDEIFESFSDFKACIVSAFPDIVEKGEFIDDSEAYIDDDAKRHVYYWASLPKYGEDFVEYDTGAVKNYRWTIHMDVKTAIYQGTRKGFGSTLGEAIDNLYTCQSPTMLNQ